MTEETKQPEADKLSTNLVQTGDKPKTNTDQSSSKVVASFGKQFRDELRFNLKSYDSFKITSGNGRCLFELKSVSYSMTYSTDKRLEALRVMLLYISKGGMK